MDGVGIDAQKRVVEVGNAGSVAAFIASHVGLSVLDPLVAGDVGAVGVTDLGGSGIDTRGTVVQSPIIGTSFAGIDEVGAVGGSVVGIKGDVASTGRAVGTVYSGVVDGWGRGAVCRDVALVSPKDTSADAVGVAGGDGGTVIGHNSAFDQF